MTKHTLFTRLFFLPLMLAATADAQRPFVPTRQDTLKGGSSPARTWWDVLYYDLTIRPDYTTRNIKGDNVITYRVVDDNHPDSMQIDLQAPLIIDSILLNRRRLRFIKDGNVWFVMVPPQKKFSIQQVAIFYSGKPKESLKAPWDGGIVWTTDSLGRPWMAVACQLVGASVWYPCKVYQGDKPDNGALISVIVPDTLVGVSNGRLQKRSHHDDGTSTYTWRVRNPINNYGITFYIGKYVDIADTFPGIRGPLEINYWVLDYNLQRARDYLHVEVHRTLKVFEHWFGPYPFYEDGFKLVEAPYVGMEHQSAIAYGNHFTNGRFGFKRLTFWDLKTDRMVVHESAHEWFGNNITAKDPADAWLQEGFAGYAEELAVAGFYGDQAGEEFFAARTTGKNSNAQPVISRYGVFEQEGEDGYIKGWMLLHMIRAILNNDGNFRNMLHGMNKHFYHQTVTTAQVENYISRVTGNDFSKVFDQYLRTTNIPVLEYKMYPKSIDYRFNNCVQNFKMPIKVNLANNPWITPTTKWQKMVPRSRPMQDSLLVDNDFYTTSRRIE